MDMDFAKTMKSFFSSTPESFKQRINNTLCALPNLATNKKPTIAVVAVVAVAVLICVAGCLLIVKLV
jgi:hypothetical protein